MIPIESTPLLTEYTLASGAEVGPHIGLTSHELMLGSVDPLGLYQMEGAQVPVLPLSRDSVLNSSSKVGLSDVAAIAGLHQSAGVRAGRDNVAGMGSATLTGRGSALFGRQGTKLYLPPNSLTEGGPCTLGRSPASRRPAV